MERKNKHIKAAISILRENRRLIFALFVFTVFVDILLIKTNRDIVIFSLLLLYVIFIKNFQIKSKETFLLCIALLTVMSVDYLFTGASVSTEKGAVWLILFFGIAIIQQWRE